MADAALRRLQRAWESSPDDMDIASEYIRELQRSSLGVSEETGRVRDFEVGVAPPIELDLGNAQDRLLWERLTSFAAFMNPMAQPNRIIVPVNEEVLEAMHGPEGPGYEGPRYQNWHRVRRDLEEAHAKGYRYVVFRRIDPPRESGDAAMRRMRRQAITGDPRAQRQYERMRERRGLPPERRNPHHSWVEQDEEYWITLDGEFLAQEEGPDRWALWKRTQHRSDTSRSAYRLLGAHYETLRSAKYWASRVREDA